MNVRDPFNLHRSPAFQILTRHSRQAVANATQRVREASVQAIEAGSQALESGKQTLEDMSTFSIPQNVPSFTSPQREIENRVWGSSGMTARSPNPNSGVLGGVGNFFEKNRDLPMYKDKPYSYASSRRHQPLYRRKRVLGAGTILLVFVLYFLGFFGSGSHADKKAKSAWGWIQNGDDPALVADWSGRRERVVDAFTLSWDAYSRYAWGL